MGGGSSEFIKTLRENDINFIYHITKLSNLSSIFKLKNLYSRQKLIDKKIDFKLQTNDLSKQLDKEKDKTNYVRFAFTYKNPLFKSFLNRHQDSDFCIFAMDVKNLEKFIGSFIRIFKQIRTT